MSGTGMDRLSEAMAVWLQYRASEQPPSTDEFLAAHPDLRELLEPMLAGEPEGGADQSRHGVGPGTTLGDFKLVGELGRGGMGIVYAAQQLSLDRRVAVKMLPPGASLHPRALARFRREAATAARIDHPGIVAVHAVGEHDGLHWFAMELLSGLPLDRYAVQARATDPENWVRRAVELTAQVAEALHFAHDQGVVHRDVKPSNVIVRPDGAPVVTDFGLARAAGLPSLTQDGEFAGTPHYVSPEQARGELLVDARSDVFSLGVTLYELLTARLPFGGHTTRAVLERIQRSEPRPPSRIDRDLPRDLDAVVLKALAKEPQHRYQSAAEFAADLRRFLAHRPVLARPIRAPQRLWRWARREPLKAALLSAVVVASGLGIYVAGTSGALRRGQEAEIADRIENLLLAATIAPHVLGGPPRDELLAEIVRLAPDDPYTVVIAATAIKNDPPKALQLLEDHLRRNGPTPAVLRLRDHLGAGAGREQEPPGEPAALSPPTLALDHYVAGEIALGRWARGEREQGQTALQHMMRAVALADRPHCQFFIGLNRAGRALGDDETVRVAVDAMVRHWPNSAAARCHRSMAWVEADVDIGRSEAQRSLELAPDNFIGLTMLARVAEIEGDHEGALALREKATKMYPELMRFVEGRTHDGDAPPPAPPEHQGK